MPSISILPLVEADIPTSTHIELSAFASHPRTPMLWRNGYTPSLYAYYNSTKTSSLLHSPEESPEEESRFLKAVDNVSGEIVGVCELTFALDPEANEAKPCPDAVVDILTVSPDRQGEGVGSLLLAHAVELADERGVMCGLESTPAGLALYTRFGFREERTIKADMRMFGWEEDYDQEAAKRVWMVRRPNEGDPTSLT